MASRSVGNPPPLSPEELGGLGAVTLGLLCLLHLALARDVPALTVMVGWTAPYCGLACLGAGLIILLRHRYPRWRLEAVLGIQLLLLALMAGSFIWSQADVDWRLILDGSAGGIIGRGLGNMLMEALGRDLAGILVRSVAMGGVFLFVYFSPLMVIPVAITSSFLYVGVSALRALSREAPPPDASPKPARAPTEPRARPPRARARSKPAAPRATPPDVQAKQDAAARTYVSGSPAQAPASDAPASVAARRAPPVAKKVRPGRARRRKMEQLPDLSLLSAHKDLSAAEGAQEKAEELERIYAEYGHPVEVISTEIGPAVTRYGVKPLRVAKNGKERPVRVRDVLSLRSDVALSLKVEALRYQAPVPGKPYVGIEIPNAYRQVVDLNGVLSSWEFQTHQGALKMGLGRDETGTAAVADLAAAPHMLVCGATGMGKSTFINALLASLLMQHGPESLHLVLVDPKQIELTPFNGVPHLVGRVVTDLAVVPILLLWLLLQMDARYALFKQHKVRNIRDFNQLTRLRKNLEPLPHIVLVIDELADLMMNGQSTIEPRLCKLAQKCRATGIHIVLATQRPSVDVITGTIKANCPTRVAFAVSSQTDSRVVLDEGGAETLLGKGDMIFKPQGRGKQRRIQGCWVDDQDVQNVVDHWRKVQRDTPDRERVEPWRGLLDADDAD